MSPWFPARVRPASHLEAARTSWGIIRLSSFVSLLLASRSKRLVVKTWKSPRSAAYRAPIWKAVGEVRWEVISGVRDRLTLANAICSIERSTAPLFGMVVQKGEDDPRMIASCRFLDGERVTVWVAIFLVRFGLMRAISRVKMARFAKGLVPLSFFSLSL